MASRQVERMMNGVGGRLAAVGILGVAIVAIAAMARADLLVDAGPAVAATLALSTLGVAMYPRGRAGECPWLPSAILTFTLAGFALIAAGTAYSLARYAGRTDFDGLAFLGYGLATGAFVKRLLQLMEESRSWGRQAVASEA